MQAEETTTPLAHASYVYDKDNGNGNGSGSCSGNDNDVENSGDNHMNLGKKEKRGGKRTRQGYEASSSPHKLETEECMPPKKRKKKLCPAERGIVVGPDESQAPESKWEEEESLLSLSLSSSSNMDNNKKRRQQQHELERRQELLYSEKKTKKACLSRSTDSDVADNRGFTTTDESVVARSVAFAAVDATSQSGKALTKNTIALSSSCSSPNSLSSSAGEKEKKQQEKCGIKCSTSRNLSIASSLGNRLPDALSYIVEKTSSTSTSTRTKISTSTNTTLSRETRKKHGIDRGGCTDEGLIDSRNIHTLFSHEEQFNDGNVMEDDFLGAGSGSGFGFGSCAGVRSEEGEGGGGDGKFNGNDNITPSLTIGPPPSTSTPIANIWIMDKTFSIISIFGICVWLVLVTFVYYVTPSRDIKRLCNFEIYAALFASALLIGSIMTKVVPYVVRSGRKTLRSGIVVGAFSVQFVSTTTNLLMATVKVPVVLDPVTNRNVYLLRWCEWTVLACLMTFFTEGVDVPMEEEENECKQKKDNDHVDKEESNIEKAAKSENINDDNENENENKEDEKLDRKKGRSEDSLHANKFTMNTGRGRRANSLFAYCLIKFQKSKNKYSRIWSVLKAPTILGFSQGISAFCGLVFPFCPGPVSWSIIMTISCILYLLMFPRLQQKRRRFHETTKGSGSVSELELCDRVRLSYQLMFLCTSMWTLLVTSYFVGSFAHHFAPEGSLLRERSLTFVCDAFIDVLAKAFYMDVIVDIHHSVFDDCARNTRRLEELRHMMSIVWECSSNVIAISVKGQNVLTTMLSPTFHKIEHLDDIHENEVGGTALAQEEEEGRDQEGDRKGKGIGVDGHSNESRTAGPESSRSRPIVFEMKLSDILSVVAAAATSTAAASSTDASPLAAFDGPSRYHGGKLSSPTGTDCGVSGTGAAGNSGEAETAPAPAPTMYFLDVGEGGKVCYPEWKFDPLKQPGLFSLRDLMLKAWAMGGGIGVRRSGKVKNDEKGAEEDGIDAATTTYSASINGSSVSRREELIVHDIKLQNGKSMRCEAKVTRLGTNSLVVVIRDISEQFRRFEAEKRAVSEKTARQKDAEANRFTRHEVKNGLLSSIGICDGLREAMGGDASEYNSYGSSLNLRTGSSSVLDSGGVRHRSRKLLMSGNANESFGDLPLQQQQKHERKSTINRRQTHELELKRPQATLSPARKTTSRGRDRAHVIEQYLVDLDLTLRDILDTILAEAMARDVIHEIYEPQLERCDLVELLSGINRGRAQRFPVVTSPSSLPIIMFDPQLLKYIHRNAVSNACKYGKRGGVVLTEVRFDGNDNTVEIDVINYPGDGHGNLVRLGRKAQEIVFAPGKRLHNHHGAAAGISDCASSEAILSSGDGAWISRKCAKTLGGDCFIQFEPDRTVFTMRCPARPYDVVVRMFPDAVGDPSNFRLPEDTWGVAIDDSKVQRKLMQRFFSIMGIPEDHQIILGQNADEIRRFADIIIDSVAKSDPTSYFLVVADENLDIVEDSTESRRCHTISGSLCLQKIRRQLHPQHERRMLALVRSANDSAADVAIYNSRAHGFMCKMPLQRDQCMAMLAPLWTKRFARVCHGEFDSSATPNAAMAATNSTASCSSSKKSSSSSATRRRSNSNRIPGADATTGRTARILLKQQDQERQPLL